VARRSDSRRGLKKRVSEILTLENLDRAFELLNDQPASQTINALFSFLPSTDAQVRWAAVTALGSVVSRVADRQMEQARVVMRRLMWQLNDESGGIGWGCPEVMGEIMASHEGLANEFAHILVSYVRKDGNPLEYEPLQQAAVWGIGRLAEVRPQLVREAIPHLLPFLKVRNASLRGLTAWALGRLGAKAARLEIHSLVHDTAEIEIFVNRKIMRCQVGELAEKAIARIEQVQH
jgi:HEAT repeat protein